MTLREQLDAKVKNGSPEELKKEIKKLFLKANRKVLKRGLTIIIYYGTPDKTFTNMTEGICFFFAGESTGKRFKKSYDENTVKEVIPLMEKEGIEVTDEPKHGRVFMSYEPLED